VLEDENNIFHYLSDIVICDSHKKKNVILIKMCFVHISYVYQTFFFQSFDKCIVFIIQILE